MPPVNKEDTGSNNSAASSPERPQMTPDSDSDSSQPTSCFGPPLRIVSNPPQNTREILESMCRTLAVELNARRMNLSNPVLQALFDRDFQAVTRPPHKMDLEKYINHLNYIQSKRPEYHLEITGMDTVVDERRGSARVFVDFEICGVYEGVTKASVAILKFRQGANDYRWRIVKYEATDGLRSWPAV